MIAAKASGQMDARSIRGKPRRSLHVRSMQSIRLLDGHLGNLTTSAIDPLRPPLKSWSDLRGMPRDITGDLAPVIGSPITQDDLEMTRQVYERTVYVWAIPHVITVHQKSKAVWVAVGDYRGGRIEAKGSSADAAANYWADAARFKDT